MRLHREPGWTREYIKRRIECCTAAADGLRERSTLQSSGSTPDALVRYLHAELLLGPPPTQRRASRRLFRANDAGSLFRQSTSRPSIAFLPATLEGNQFPPVEPVS